MTASKVQFEVSTYPDGCVRLAKHPEDHVGDNDAWALTRVAAHELGKKLLAQACAGSERIVIGETVTWGQGQATRTGTVEDVYGDGRVIVQWADGAKVTYPAEDWCVRIVPTRVSPNGVEVMATSRGDWLADARQAARDLVARTEVELDTAYAMLLVQAREREEGLRHELENERRTELALVHELEVTAAALRGMVEATDALVKRSKR